MTQVMSVSGLRCEYRANPLGIAGPRPRLSWLVGTEVRDARQGWYRILVSMSLANLAAGVGDCWDSGRVQSSETCQVVYAGADLRPCAVYYWKVMAWDANGVASGWSEVAHWEMTLAPQEWQGQWITKLRPAEDERPILRDAKWIRESGPPGTTGILSVRLDCTLPAGAIRSAWLVFIIDGKADFWNHQRPYLEVNGQTDPSWREVGSLRAPKAWQVTHYLREGGNDLRVHGWRHDGAAFIGRLNVEFMDGRRLEFNSSKLWNARVTLEQQGKLPVPAGTDAFQGSPAQEIGTFGHGPWSDDHPYNLMDKVVPPILLRRRFSMTKPVIRARVYATACGIYELSLNGMRIGDHVLAPGWTDYSKRLQYQCYDITPLLRTGENILGSIVADGWFSGHIFFGANIYGTHKALLLQVHLDFIDGSQQIICSDQQWQVATGATRYADLYMGQEVDYRKDLPHWCTTWSDDAPWQPVGIVKPKIGNLVVQSDEPIRITARIPPCKVHESAPGTYLVDFGQNLVGWIRLHLRGCAGSTVHIRHGEMLTKQGTLYTENLRGARATDIVFCSADDHWFEPRLTFHGFRYVEISGVPGVLDAVDMAAIVVNTDCDWSGSFSCSDPSLEKLQSNIRWGQRGNFLSIPTDCPQRDERAGWTGDAQIFVRTATFNMDCANFFAKYQRDMVDGQHANGSYPDVAPTFEPTDNGHFAWGDAGVMVPWTIWQVYGDVRIIEENLDSMLKWVNFRTSRAKQWLNTEWSFGDWVSPQPQTPHELLGPLYHAWAARLLAEMAEAIGRHDVTRDCRAIFSQVRSAWTAAHVRADGRISSDTQAAYVLALRSGVLPETNKSMAAVHLLAAIERAGWHLHTGFLGTGHLLPALSDLGLDAVAFRLLMTDTYPSWLYTIKHGATTMWERWDSYHADLGPLNIGNMNSYNHYAFGAVGEWMYAVIAGIECAAPGFRKVRVRPRAGGILTHARAEYRSVRGTIVVAWHIQEGRFFLSVVIPVGVEAEVHIPSRNHADVRESGQLLAQSPGITTLREENAQVVVRVGSGKYRFTAMY